jgi:predicted amidohydrolase
MHRRRRQVRPAGWGRRAHLPGVSDRRGEVFQLELRAHGVFNNMYVICANRIGAGGEKDYVGTSGIYGPDGEIIA